MPLQNIVKNNISEIVYNQFMNALVTGEWKPGDRIPSENELTGKLNVSRISVRSALQRLAGLGLIESRQGEGTFVCEYSGKQYMNNLVPIAVLGQTNIFDLMEFRQILDSEIAALVATRASDDEIDKLRENYENHMSVTEDEQKSAEYDTEFHCMLAHATHNPMIEQIYDVFKLVFQNNMYKIVRIMGTDGARKNHRKIIDAIEARDPELARHAMSMHIQETVNVIMKNEKLG